MIRVGFTQIICRRLQNPDFSTELHGRCLAKSEPPSLVISGAPWATLLGTGSRGVGDVLLASGPAAGNLRAVGIC